MQLYSIKMRYDPYRESNHWTVCADFLGCNRRVGDFDSPEAGTIEAAIFVGEKLGKFPETLKLLQAWEKENVDD